MEIRCVIERTVRDTLCFDTSFKSLLEVKMTMDANKTYTIITEHAPDGVIAADLGAMLLYVRHLAYLTTWEELEYYLSADLLLAYRVKPVIPTHIFSIVDGKIKIVPLTPTIEEIVDGVISDESPSELPRLDINFVDTPPEDFTEEIQSGDVTVSEDGTELTLTGNSWQRVPIDFVINSRTRLEFDFKSSEEGLVHGVAIVVEAEAADSARTFVVYGSRNVAEFGQHSYHSYLGTDRWQHFSIPIGKIYPVGTVAYACFVNNDSGSTAESIFKNVAIKDVILDSISVTGYIARPSIVSVTHNAHLGMDYGTRLDPNIRNHPFLRHKQTDVIFKHTDAETVVDFNNCIPIINGKIHYPVVFNNELYAVNGTQVLKAALVPDIGTLLMDFTNIGGMELVRFSDCVYEVTPYGHTYTLPTGKTLANKSFVVVLAGRFIMACEVAQLGDTVIAIDPYKLNLENILISNKILNGYHIRNTSVVRVAETPDEYMATVNGVNHYESFLVIMDTPSIAFHMLNSRMRINPRILKFPGAINGLLMRKMTREIVDYNRDFDTDGTVVRFAEIKRCNRVIVDSEDNLMEVGYSGQTQGPTDVAINAEDDGYVIIDILSIR